MSQKITTIIFDLGGVLVDWKPEYLYNKVFKGDVEKVTWFLNTVCTLQWNMEQDAGRTIFEAEKEKIALFPAYEKEIKMFYVRWTEMFSGPIKENVTLFKKLKATKKYKIIALTNWSAEKWETALNLFPFFNDFDGVVVSGFEHTRKPFEAIYKIALTRYKITPTHAIFIDDNLNNCLAAKKLGLHAIHYKNPKNLKSNLQLFNIHFQ